MICDNIAAVKGKIRQAAQKSGRSPDDITLVCVTKGRSLEEIKEALACGITNIGENRVQEALLKHGELYAPRSALPAIKWHLIGHLQTNKAGDAVAMFDLIHSVDSLKLAKEIDRQAARINKVQDILIEVNISGEASKYGLKAEELIKVVSDIIILQNIKVCGLMTMAPVVRDKEEARPYFRKLHQLQGEVNSCLSSVFRPLSSELSMGMSGDYEVAVEEGATIVRIGTAIFEG
jgi:pyridoxal phosphate enzyme (YggS family)